MLMYKLLQHVMYLRTPMYTILLHEIAYHVHSCQILWRKTQIDADFSCAEILKNKGYNIVCAGIRNSQSIYDAEMKKPLLLVIGGEKRGISSSLLSQADSIVRIDYASNFKGSLSAASSAAIIGFEVMHQNS